MSPPRLKDGSEFLHHQEDFTVIGTRIVLRLDVDRPGLAGVGAAVEIVTGNDVRVIEAEAGGFRDEGNAAHAMRRDVGRAFLGGAVHVARDHLAVPVHAAPGVSVSL